MRLKRVSVDLVLLGWDLKYCKQVGKSVNRWVTGSWRGLTLLQQLRGEFLLNSCSSAGTMSYKKAQVYKEDGQKVVTFLSPAETRTRRPTSRMTPPKQERPNGRKHTNSNKGFLNYTEVSVTWFITRFRSWSRSAKTRSWP